MSRPLVDGATGWPFAEGAVGAGTGMSCLGWKGGIGSASRVADGHTVGVLVLANFGSARQLVVAGVPVGRLLPGDAHRAAAGSCIAVVATDAPLSPGSLERRAPSRARARAHGLGRPPRQRRDLYGLRDGARGEEVRAASSIRCSRPRSTRPRRPS